MPAKIGFLLILRWTVENMARTTVHALSKGLALNGSFGSTPDEANSVAHITPTRSFPIFTQLDTDRLAQPYWRQNLLMQRILMPQCLQPQTTTRPQLTRTDTSKVSNPQPAPARTHP